MSTNNKSTIIVIKLGGTEGVNIESICKDTAKLIQQGFQIVLVHGGSTEANALGEALGHPPRFVTSPSGYTSRYTDEQTIKIFTMAVAGKINPNLVKQLQVFSINAIGLNGLDGNLIQAKRKSSIRIIENGKRKILHGDFTGTITKINSTLLELLLSQGYTPVIAPLAISPDGEILNIDADRAAARIAGALQARTLMLLTGAPGLLRDFPDESSLIPKIQSSQLDDALTYAKGRMKKKVLGTKEAIAAGTKKVVIADGRKEMPVIQALNGGGTHIQ
jgi:acetylglutamate/LysW-gamma-L-alpha-aminoadipate kinase